MDFYENYVKKLIPTRPVDGHKGTFGHVLNIAGSGFYTGAAYFSSISALKVGCGRVTLASTEPVLYAVSALGPDIILKPLEGTKEKTIHPKAVKKLINSLERFDVISIGCGISMNKETMNFLKNFIDVLKNHQTPIIFDADGLTHIGKLKITKLPSNSILTPHPKELSDLMEVSVDNILKQPEFWVKECCEKYNCTTILKLHKTIVSDNKGNFYVNNTGNTALSHGGSGDILCGMISGFIASGSRSEPKLACEGQAKQGELNDGDVRVCDNKLHRSKQGLGCFEASVLAVYLHGKAAEIASEELTEYSTLSSDLLNYIPKAIKSIL